MYGLGVDVAGANALAVRVLGIELQPELAEAGSQFRTRVLTEVRQRLVLLLAEVLGVLLAGPSDRIEPGVAADLFLARVRHRVLDLVMVADRIVGLVFRVLLVALLQQRRIEHGLLGLRVRVQACRERLPHSGEFRHPVRVVESGELAAEPLVVVHDERGDVDPCIGHESQRTVGFMSDACGANHGRRSPSADEPSAARVGR